MADDMFFFGNICNHHRYVGFYRNPNIRVPEESLVLPFKSPEPSVLEYFRILHLNTSPRQSLI